MPARKFTDEQEQLICHRYLAGENTYQLSAAYVVSVTCISRILRRNGVKIRPQRCFSDEQAQDICQRYRAGESTLQLGEVFGVGSGTIWRILKRKGVKTRLLRKLTDVQEQDICQRYQAGENSTELGEVFGVSTGTILQILKCNSIKLRPQRCFSDAQEAEICSRYQNGETSSQLGKAFGVNSGTIGQILKRNRVKARSRSESGRKYTDAQEADFCQQYLAGSSFRQVAESFGVSASNVRDALRRQGVKSRSISEATKSLSNSQEQEICRRYIAGESGPKLGQAFGVNGCTIMETLKRNGLEARSAREAKGGLTDAQDAELCRRYKVGESTGQLAASFDVSQTSVKNILKRHGVKARSAREARGGLTDAQEAELCSRYEAGETTIRLAAAFGIGSTSTISAILKRKGIQARSLKEAHGGLTAAQEAEVCARYQSGEATPQLGKAFGINTASIGRILKRNGIEARSMREIKGGLTDDQEAEVCERYKYGETSPQLGKAFGVSPNCICNILARNNVEVRQYQSPGELLQHALDSVHRYAEPRECEFYLFELARYSATYCKPGIAFDTVDRVRQGGGEYGSEVLRLIFGTRAEAYFLEQAVLYATLSRADCPDDLLDWGGASEVRAMPADDMASIVLHLADELAAMGTWAFATAYVPMTSAQRAICHERAMQLQEAG